MLYILFMETHKAGALQGIFLLSQLFSNSSIILLELQSMFKLKVPVKLQCVDNPNFPVIQGCNWVISEESKVLHFLNKLTGQQKYYCYTGKCTDFYRAFK